MGENKCEPQISFPIKPPGPPKVWKIVEIKRKDAVVPIRLAIQEIPEDRYEEVAEFMCKYFIPDEPMCKSVKGENDPVYVETYRKFWMECLKDGLSVAAFTKNPNGGKSIIAGVNILALSSKEEHYDADKCESKLGQIVFNAIMDLCEDANIYEKYGVNKYMAAFGLSVQPLYRGAALGAHLLDARGTIGREYNISLTSTVFTSPISQKLAERCGFETVLEKNYDDIVDEKGDPIFPGIEAEVIKVMAKRLY